MSVTILFKINLLYEAKSQVSLGINIKEQIGAAKVCLKIFSFCFIPDKTITYVYNANINGIQYADCIMLVFILTSDPCTPGCFILLLY